MRRPLCGLAALCAALSFAAPARAQDGDPIDEQFELWAGGFISGPIAGDLFTISDVHFRTWNDFSPHWILVRPGLALRLMDGMFAVVGYAWTPHFSQRDSVGFVDEHRIWEQWQWEIHDPPSGFRFQMRTRLEQRFRPQLELDCAWRIRQMLRMSVPIDRAQRVLFVLWDELFIGLNDVAGGYQRTGLDQNRIFVGWAFVAAPGALRFELGYFNQWIHRPGNPMGDAMNHVAMLNTYVSWR